MLDLPRRSRVKLDYHTYYLLYCCRASLESLREHNALVEKKELRKLSGIFIINLYLCLRAENGIIFIAKKLREEKNEPDDDDNKEMHD